MKNNVYKIGFFIGWGCIITAFFINLGVINLLGLGFFVFGVTFFYNFYLNDGKSDLVNYWWQDVFGFYCIAIGVYYQFGFSRFRLGWLLTGLFIVSTVIKYNYAKKKLKRTKRKRTDQVTEK